MPADKLTEIREKIIEIRLERLEHGNAALISNLGLQGFYGLMACIVMWKKRESFAIEKLGVSIPGCLVHLVIPAGLHLKLNQPRAIGLLGGPKTAPPAIVVKLIPR